jgi:dynein heavy chain, axonemal
MLWTKDQGEALDQMRTKKNSMKDCNQRQSDILKEMSSWCIQDLGSAVNRRKIETLGTYHVSYIMYYDTHVDVTTVLLRQC